MDFSRRSPHPTCSSWKCWILLCLSLAFYQDQIAAYSVSAPHSKYICPEGRNVSLTCTITGHPMVQHVQLSTHWTFNKERNPDCTEEYHSWNMTDNHHKTHKVLSLHSKVFHKILMNISQLDSGGYCCFVYEREKKHKGHVVHSYIELQVKTEPPCNLTELPSTTVEIPPQEAPDWTTMTPFFPQGGNLTIVLVRDDPNLQTCSLHSLDEDNDGKTAAALAILACIVGLLCMPLILILVYKQRKAVTNRRAQELVRMDSDAQGIENPVFDDPPIGNLEQRPRLIFMASRQQSDTGRHLLSEPNTPLSPPGPNDCFFPTLEPLPDSPDPV